MRLTRDLGLLAYYFLFGVGVYVRGGRPTHRRGTAARGAFTAKPDAELGELPFFESGREWIATVRHGNVAFDDDAAMDLRGCALRLADAERPDSPHLDLVMNTGEVTFSTASDFLRYTLASGPKPWVRRPIDERGLERLLRRQPRMRAQYASALRRAPHSFTGLHYYSKLVYRWRMADGRPRVARFRIRPENAEPEQGLPGHADFERPWRQERAVGEQRPYDYLRAEFMERVQEKGARYRLEVQVRDSDGDPRSELFDPGRGWDSKTHPWRHLGTAVLDTPLSAFDTETLRFNIGVHPAFLGFQDCRSLRDYGSIPYVRTRVYAFTQRLRKGVFRRRIERQRRQRRIDDSHRVGPLDMSRKQMRDTSIVDLVLGWVRW